MKMVKGLKYTVMEGDQTSGGELIMEYTDVVKVVHLKFILLTNKFTKTNKKT